MEVNTMTDQKWKDALRHELSLGLIAATEDGSEKPVSIDLEFKEGLVTLSWKDGVDEWWLAIHEATLVTLAAAMERR